MSLAGLNNPKGEIIKKTLLILGILIAVLAILWFATVPLKKNWAKKYTTQGIEYFQAENDRQAILEFEKSNLLYKTAENYYYLGQLYFFNLNYGRSEFYFKKAINKDANYAKAKYGLAEIYLYQEKPDKALEAIGDTGNNELLAIAKAKSYLTQNEGEKAKEALEDFENDLAKFYQIKIDLYNLENLNKTADTLSWMATNDTSERTVLPQIPNADEVQVLKDALSQIQKVSNPATKKVILAEGLNQTGDPEVAIGISKKIVEDNPDYRDAKVFLGHSYLIIKNYEQAKEILLVAKDLDPVYKLTWEYLASAYEGLGDTDSAKDCNEKSEKL